MELGSGLPVHHLDENKWNLESRKLAALCNRCHLKIQHRVVWYRVLDGAAQAWTALHIEQFSEWARRRGDQRCGCCDYRPGERSAG
jgi:hypothetical protein